MDTRFTRTWHEMDALRDRGEPFDRVLRQATNRELVEGLAGAGTEDAVAANAIATHLLNRLRRARYVGALVVAVVMVLALVLVDAFFTGTWGVLEGGPHILTLGLLAIAIALVALVRLWPTLRY